MILNKFLKFVQNESYISDSYQLLRKENCVLETPGYCNSMLENRNYYLNHYDTLQT